MKERILAEICRITTANAGIPPGSRLFERETGIRQGAWRGVYWARWGDAIAEAGFKPNEKFGAIGEIPRLRMIAEATREYGKIPSAAELRLYARKHPDGPSGEKALRYFRTKAAMLERLSKWVAQNPGYDDVAEMLSKDGRNTPDDSPSETTKSEGSVYLLRSGPHYKIGRSDEIERRVKEIRVAQPEPLKLEHTIRTDDPSGIEAYWHRRFADRRMNGEWFKLTSTDVAAFKRRKFQ
ncbi:GIY-YIG nuclease family protein [Parvibaculum sedimenti]|uniref:GIY-YIG nuclease family protein n=2 Tax=Parvibaculum sedimenti TaxID=2608632 RepID=A0A6N6VII7_9HYPH|nr:GIY-YIG nuclease family protein [Parvibaculum sedimenti]